MFKKFKDKLAEEMKQSPARLQASMQQLAQAVVSPSLSSTSIQDLSSKENFSLTEETDETPKNSPAKHGFQTVDLTSPSLNSSTSRKSSISSNVSDASFFFPIYENSGSVYHLQSDIDQSASEIDDNISPQIDRVSKEQLYTAYRKAKTKYDKYRGRFTDLVAHYREIERAKTKLESILVETQDKALRRISDLKEQCQLEQQAKAHLEDALRNDIEEKDHVISSLRTKIKLLQEKNPNSEGINNMQVIQNPDESTSIDNLVDISHNIQEEDFNKNSKLTEENINLKEKLQKMETFLEKYKEMLKRSKDKILDVTNEKNSLERDYDILQRSSFENTESIKNELLQSRKEYKDLKEEVEVLKKREEESVISLAENKLSIHRELEGKEDQIKQLRLELKETLGLENSLKEIIETQKQELEKIKLVANQNAEANHEHLRGKTEALKHVQTEMQQKLISLEANMTSKYNEEINKNKILRAKLEELETKSKTTENNTEKIEKLIQKLEEKESILSELKTKNKDYEKSLEGYKIDNIKLKEQLTTFKSEIQILQSSTDNDSIDYKKEIKQLKQDLMHKSEICHKSDLKLIENSEAFAQLQQKLQLQDKEIQTFRNKTMEEEKLLKLQDELENKNTEILGLKSELKSQSTTINDLKKEINNLINHRNNLNKYLRKCKKVVKTFKDDYLLFKSNVKNNVTEGKRAIFDDLEKSIKVISSLNDENASLHLQIIELKEKIKITDKLKNNSNSNSVQLEKIENEKKSLEKALKEAHNEIEAVKIKIIDYNKLEKDNNSFNLEMQELESKLKDNEKLIYDITLEKEINLKDFSLLKEQYEVLLNESNMKLSEKENLNKEYNKLLEEHKNVLSTIESLANSDQMNLTKEIEIMNFQLNTKSNELAELEKNCIVEKQNSEKISTECIKYKEMIEEQKLIILNLNQQIINSKQMHENLIIELNESKCFVKSILNIESELKQMINDLEKKLQKTIQDKVNIESKLQQEVLKSETYQNELLESLNITSNEIKELKEYNLKLLSQQENLVSFKEELESLQIEKRDLMSQLNEQQLSYTLLTNETTSLKDNQKDLLKLNDVLKQSQNELTEKLKNLNKKLADSDLVKLKNDELTKFLENLKHELSNLEQYEIKYENLEHELQNYKSYSLEIEKSLFDRIKELNFINTKLRTQNHNSRTQLEEKNFELKEIESKNIKLLEEIDQWTSLKLNIEDIKMKTSKEIDKWRDMNHDVENILLHKQSEYKMLLDKYTKLEEELKITYDMKLNELNNENTKNMEGVMIEKQKLESQLDETLVTFQAKETQMQAVNQELKNQTTRLREQLKINEEEQNLRIKQIGKEFQAQLHDKEKELQAALEKRFDRQQNYESDVIQEYKEQLKDFQIELTKKSEQIERLILANERLKKENQEELENLLSSINKMKSEHSEEIQEIDKKWKHIIKQKTCHLENKHEQEITEFTNEWRNERKTDENTELIDKELENTTRVAMAAVQSNTGSFHTLQQTLFSQKRELAELRKLVKIRQESVEDSTEIEYLRNILYEYMMGKETMVLAKVIAAVVKFDQEQTSKVLKKEEDKLSLLGSLGLT